jgi:PPOX class probable F420-dependent enzyme
LNRGAVELSAASLASLLDHWPVARLATVTASGNPHVLPVVFVREGDCVYTPVDGKRKAGAELARVRNVRYHGAASLLLDHYDREWNRLWWVRLEGAIDVLHPADAALHRLRDALRDKYPQYANVTPFAGTPTALRLRWQRVVVWTQSGTREPIEQAIAASRPQLP